MAQELSYERPNYVFFATIRTINSRLWFVNNKKLHQMILSFLAKYSETHGVVVYAFIVMGNHYHLLAKFPKSNKADFFRAFNAITAKLTGTFVEEYPGGKLWGRRVRVQALVRNEDILHWYYYIALNPVDVGIARTITQYRGYNSFFDGARGRKLSFRLTDWKDFNNRKRFNRALTIADCTKEYTLRFARLPGFEALSAEQYREKLYAELEERWRKLVEKRTAEGKGFLTSCQVAKIVPGTMPQSTKTSKRNSRRPLVLTLCSETRRLFLNWYFAIADAYQRASNRFRRGELLVDFPYGTYRPPTFNPAAQ